MFQQSYDHVHGRPTSSNVYMLLLVVSTDNMIKVYVIHTCNVYQSAQNKKKL
jgi:hypothetical protein